MGGGARGREQVGAPDSDPAEVDDPACKAEALDPLLELPGLTETVRTGENQPQLGLVTHQHPETLEDDVETPSREDAAREESERTSDLLLRRRPGSLGEGLVYAPGQPADPAGVERAGLLNLSGFSGKVLLEDYL